MGDCSYILADISAALTTAGFVILVYSSRTKVMAILKYYHIDTRTTFICIMAVLIIATCTSGIVSLIVSEKKRKRRKAEREQRELGEFAAWRQTDEGARVVQLAADVISAVDEEALRRDHFSALKYVSATEREKIVKELLLEVMELELAAKGSSGAVVGLHPISNRPNEPLQYERLWAEPCPDEVAQPRNRSERDFDEHYEAFRNWAWDMADEAKKIN